MSVNPRLSVDMKLALPSGFARYYIRVTMQPHAVKRVYEDNPQWGDSRWFVCTLSYPPHRCADAQQDIRPIPMSRETGYVDDLVMYDWCMRSDTSTITAAKLFDI
jgi:hypothetical protein